MKPGLATVVLLIGLWGFGLSAWAQPALPSPTDSATNVSPNAALSWSLGEDNLLLNGGFEAGIGLGWTIETVGGTTVRAAAAGSGAPVLPPLQTGLLSGTTFAVLGSDRLAGRAVLSQRVHLPAASGRLRLSWAAAFGGSSFSQPVDSEFRVELRAPMGSVEAVLFSTENFNGGAKWKRYSVDVSAWRGQEWELALVFDQGGIGSAGSTTVVLDEVRLVAESTPGTEFEVLLGPTPNLGPSDLLGKTERAVWALTNLVSSRTYFWQVVAVQSGIRNAGPVWSFTTSARKFPQVGLIAETSRIPPWVVTEISEAWNLRVVDSVGQPRTVARGPVRLASQAESTRPPSVLITEVAVGTTNAVEFANLSDAPVSLDGWRMELFQGVLAREKFAFPSGVSVPPGAVFQVHARGPAGEFPSFGLANVLSFGPLSAVVLYDRHTNLVDAFCATGVAPDQLRSLRPVELTDWQWPTVRGYLETNQTWQRVGALDRNRAEDWLPQARSIGAQNAGLRHLEPGPGPLPVTPSTLSLNGLALAAPITFSQPAHQVTLLGEVNVAGTLVPFRSSEFSVLAAPPLTLASIAGLREGGGPVEALAVRLPAPQPGPVTVRLQLDPAELAVWSGPDFVTIPAGQTEARLSLEAVDNAWLDGTRRVVARGEAPGFQVLPVTLGVDDNESATLTLEVPTELREGASFPGTSGILRVSSAPDRSLEIQLESSRPDVIRIRGPVQVPPGVTEVSVELIVPENHRLTGDQTVELRATVAGWTPAVAVTRVLDNDAAQLDVRVDGRLVEGGLTLTNAGVVTLRGVTPTNLVVTLTPADPSEFTVPASVVILAGESGARFNVTPVDDEVTDGTRRTLLTAQAAGFTDGTTEMPVADNDPARFEFAPIASPRVAGDPFPIEIRALDVNGQLLSGTSRGVPIRAANAAGAPIWMGSLRAVFIDGLCSATVTIATPDPAVHLVAERDGARGESSEFNVLPDPVVARVQLRVLDLAWDSVRGRLLASVAADDPAHPNQIVILDSLTGAVTGSFAAGPFEAIDPLASLVREGRLLIDGNDLYVSARGARRVQRFNLSTDTLVRDTLVSRAEAPGPVSDLAAVPGRPGFVLVGQSDGGSPTGVTLLRTNGSVAAEPVFATLLVAGAEAGALFGYVENSPFPAGRIQVGADGSVSANYLGVGPVLWAGGDMKRSGPDVVFAGGEIVDFETYAPRGRYAVTGQVRETFPLSEAQGRVETSADGQQWFFLTREAGGSPRQLLQIFHRDEPAAPRHTLRILTGPATAGRLVRLGDGALAFNTPDQIHLLRSPWFVPTPPFATVTVTQTTEPATPVLGTEFVWTLTVTNSGPRAATDLLLTDQFPAGVELLGASVSHGTALAGTHGMWMWQQLNFPVGATATAQLRVRSGIGGSVVNRMRVESNEANPALPPASFEFTTPIRLELQPGTSASLAGIVRDAVWDAPRARLYVSQEKGRLAAVSAVTGLAEFELDPGGVAGKLGLSLDATALWVVVDGHRLRQLELGSLAWDAGFYVGGKVVDFSPVPGRAGALLVSLIDPSGALRLVVFEDGVANPLQQTVSNSMGITFGASPDRFYGLKPSWNSTEWRSYRLEAAGFTELHYAALPANLGYTAATYLDGRLLLSSGEFLEVNLGGIVDSLPGSGPDTFVGVDATIRRAFVAGGTAGKGRLDVLDLDTFASVDRVAVPSLDATATRLVRYGADGIALVSGTGKLILVRSAEMPSDPLAELRTAVASAPAVATVGEPVRITVTATNAGPAAVDGVRLSLRLPPETEFISARSADGACTHESGTVVCQAGPLAAGGQVSLVVELRPQTAGVLGLIASVTSRAQESDFRDNATRFPLAVQPPPTLEAAFPVALQVVDFVVNPARDRIYASVAPGDPLFANSLVELNPASGAIRVLAAGLDGPGHLALAADGSLLYATVADGRRCVRLDLIRARMDLEFDLTGDAVGLTVPPGNPRRVIASIYDYPTAFDDGVLVGPGQSHGPEIEFYSADEFVVHQPNSSPTVTERMASRPEGLVLLEELGRYVPIGGMTAAGGRMYSREGSVFDLPGLTFRGRFGVYGPVAPDPAAGVACFLVPETGRSILRVFSAESFAEAGRLTLPGVTGTGDKLRRWGADGLVFAAAGRLRVLRTALIPSPLEPPAELTAQIEWLPATPEGLKSARLTWRNVGTAAAGGVVGTLRLAGLQFVRTETEARWSLNGRDVEFRWPELPAGAAVTAQVWLQSTGPGLLWAEGSVRSAGRELTPRDNRAALVDVSSLADPDVQTRVPLMAHSLVVDPHSRRLILSVPASSERSAGLLVLDPQSRQPSRWISTDGQPGRLAVDPGGRFLYVGLDDGQRVERLRLPGLRPDLQVASARSPFPELTDLAVAPGDGRTIAAARGFDLAVFDDAVPRIKAAPALDFATDLEFGSNPNRLWAVNSASSDAVIRRFRLDASGAHLDFQRESLSQPFGPPFRIRGQRLFAARGEVVDIETLERITLLPVPADTGIIAVDDLPGRVVLGSQFGGSLPVFDAESLELRGEIRLTGLLGGVRQLVRWGADGLAALADSNLVLLRSPFLAPDATVDTDGDGLPDAWELDHGLPARRADAGEEPDADGLSNADEFAAGTDPWDSGSGLRLEISPDGRVRFPSQAGRRYLLEAADDLSGGGRWVPEGTERAGNGEILEQEISLPDAGQVFLRVRLQP